MPYPTEHACRLREPGEFIEESFRRGEREHDGKKYSVIFGKLKESKTMADQAYRYPIDTWQEDEARKHCKDHNGISFEPAKKPDGDQATAIVRFRAYGTHWAIRPTIVSMIGEYAGIPDEAFRAELRFSDRLGFNVVDNVAVIPIYGVLEQRSNIFTVLFGGTSYETISAQIIEAIRDEEVERIILDIDSPGGSVHGVAELADMIWTAKDTKPIVAIANNLCASAAYWLASACSEVVCASQTSLLGSIGVVALHRDCSRLEDKVGIKTTEIVSGRYKRIASQYEPLSEAGKEVLQAQVDELYRVFIEAVAKYRGISVISAHERMGNGREFIGQSAIDAGLANRIESFTELIGRMAYNSGKITFADREITAMDKNGQIKKGPPEKEEKKEKEGEEKEEEQAPPKKQEEEEEEEEEEGESVCAVMAEKNRIMALLSIEGCRISEELKTAIVEGHTIEQYMVATWHKQPARMQAMKKESQFIPVAIGESGEDGQAVIKNACKTVNERRR